jgi:hypothetical protein
MSIAFTRSMRALEADRFRSVHAGLFIGVLLLGWLLWFGLARIAVYEVAQQAVVQGDPAEAARRSPSVTIVTHFPAIIAWTRLRSGQLAWFTLDHASPPVKGRLTGVVTRIEQTSADGQVQVILTLMSNASLGAPLRPGLTGSVEIEVERVSPAMLLLRTISQ